ncbi:MAG: metal-dependent hydrolase [Polyangiaceae bacterium]
MASIGHVAVGLAAGRLLSRTPRQRLWLSLGLSALSLLPDADVIGFALRVPYGAPWGHRGATHSLVFAAGVALLALGARRWLRLPALAWFGAVFAVVASHGLLDALTDGGRGVALLWPFDLTRYFAPWRPIPVAPIGLRFLSVRGLSIALVELLLFAPLFWYGLTPRKAAKRA